MARKKKGVVTLRKLSRKKVSVKKSTRSKTPSRASRKGPYSGAFRTIGGLAGGYLGGPYGASIGMSAGDLVAKVTGFGDYKVQSNSIVMGQSVPSFRSAGDGMICCHREFITDITGSVNFLNTSVPIQPGLPTLFPWLQILAQAFEEYTMMGLVFEYRPSSGTALTSASSALGVVIFATNYDVLDGPFTNKQQMESYEYSTSTVPFASCIHAVECKRSSRPVNTLFTRTSVVPSGGDARLYDVGSFQYATQGMQSVYVVGELWVTYDIKFSKPRIPPSIGVQSYIHFTEGAANTASAANPFGTTAAVIRHADASMNAVTVSTNTSAVINFTQPATYLFMCMWTAAGLISANASNANGANLITVAAFVNYTATGINGFNTTRAFLSGVITCVTAGSSSFNQVTINGPAGLATGTLDVFIFPVTNVLTLDEMIDRARNLQIRVAELEMEKKDDFISCFSSACKTGRP